MTARERTPPVTFRDFMLEGIISDRQRPGESLGIVAKREIERYYDLLDAGTDDLDRVFSLKELKLILFACKEVTWSGVAKNARYLQFEVRDAIEHEDAANHYKIDGQELLRKLAALAPHQVAALTDVIEMFWLNPPKPFAILVNHEFLKGLRIVASDAPYDTEVVDTPLTGTVADADLVEDPTDDDPGNRVVFDPVTRRPV
jgi:hypothetical protein